MDTVIITDPKSTEMKEVMDSLIETFQKVTVAPPQKYKKYGQDQIERFIRLIQEEELTVPKSAEQCGYSSQQCVQAFKQVQCWMWISTVSIFDRLIDTNPSITLEEAKQNLSEHFDGLQVPLSRIRLKNVGLKSRKISEEILLII
ncbi:hypothetical protein INT47_013021 [Mucor saturninus]|uniref:Uncharacterized protein n=1 Tax=Mucor saturninus TaxID=64648 RepID=A0A8H7R0D2_9FUNG|nr:hypothetical protein INT47_013021 [Mucor saturninus]